ncbi:MAG: DNA primase [bacterium]|nr:DNA primase [bacterium]
MSDSVEQIKERLPIEEVVGSYIKLDKAGSHLKARCPFHNEKTPSFFVSRERQSFYCFGCGQKGDIFTFVENFEGVDFKGALKILAERAGVDIETRESNPEAKSEKENVYEVLEKATAFFEKNLDINGEAKKYLKDRGLSDKTVKSFRLGFAKDEWRSLREYLASGGVSDKTMLSAGLIKRAEKNGQEVYYDTFRARIIFPLWDSAGRIVAFSGRIFPGPEKEGAPKYLNSPETVVFRKSVALYGLHLAKTAIRKLDHAILVEGQMDLVLCHEAGFPNTVATSGTSMTEEHLAVIKRFSDNLKMAYDADSAGLRAGSRAVKMALAAGMNVKIAPLPKGEDPADVIRKDPLKWKDLIGRSSHAIDFYTDIAVSEKTDDRELVKKIKSDVLPFILKVPSSMDRDSFLRSVAYKTGIREETLFKEMQGIKDEDVGQGKESGGVSREKEKPASRVSSLEKRIVGILKWQSSDKNPSVEISEIEKRIEEIITDDGRERLKEVAKIGDEELVFEAKVMCEKDGGLSLGDVEKLLDELEMEYLGEKVSSLMDGIFRTERHKDNEKRTTLLEEHMRLTTRRENLRKKLSAG